MFTRIPDYYLLPGLMVSRSFFSPHFGFGKLTGFRRCNAYPIAYRRRKLNECFCYQMEGKSKNITVSISLIFMACCVCFTIICTFFLFGPCLHLSRSISFIVSSSLSLAFASALRSALCSPAFQRNMSYVLFSMSVSVFTCHST